MVAFIVTLMMAGIAYFWLLNPFKGIFSLTVTYISAVALTTYTFLLIYGVPGAWTTGSQRFEPVRFLEWLFTTPGMIFAIGCLTVRPGAPCVLAFSRFSDNRKLSCFFVCFLFFFFFVCFSSFWDFHSIKDT